MIVIILSLITYHLSLVEAKAASSYDNPDTLFVARDGTGQFRTVNEAVEVCRAFMEYHKVIFVKKGVYKEKVVIPSWLTNIEICGEDAQQTVITYDDHANIRIPKIGYDTSSPQGGTEGGCQPMGTFRTYTVKVEGQDITFKNITIENNSARLGQAVALHTEGDRLKFINVRFLGHQDTIYTGMGGTRCYFDHCYIEGTTDFIFGPSTAWFEQCTIRSKANSYITAASTPQNVKYGYVFNGCRLIADEGINKVYLGRPWRPYAYTLFINTEMGSHIVPEGWENWRNPENEKTARYAEYGSTGPGANPQSRVTWARQLTKKEAQSITLQNVMGDWKL
ncbi:MAG: pectin esterase [Prevotella sp.]|nr:pectin esterase [Prevotella sp.]